MSARGAGPDARFSALLSRFPRAVVSLVKDCLPKIRRAVPYSHQVVYEYANSVVVSFGMSERGYEAIVAMSVTPGAVQLYFDKSLADPRGLLKGTGTKVRSLTLASADDLDRRDVQALFKRAVAQANVEGPVSGRAIVIFKSDAKAGTAGTSARNSRPNAAAVTSGKAKRASARTPSDPEKAQPKTKPRPKAKPKAQSKAKSKSHA